jgi:Ni/Fe-hydrogenase subunit HybB-like protein
MLLNERIRWSKQGQFTAALLIVLGFILNRMNVSITSLERYTNAGYFPTWQEISVSLMVIALGFAAFRLAVKYLPVFPDQAGHRKTAAPGQEFEVILFKQAVS